MIFSTPEIGFWPMKLNGLLKRSRHEKAFQADTDGIGFDSTYKPSVILLSKLVSPMFDTVCNTTYFVALGHRNTGQFQLPTTTSITCT